jgi:hypothetical protein
MQNGHFKFGDNQITKLEMETVAIWSIGDFSSMFCR